MTAPTLLKNGVDLMYYFTFLRHAQSEGNAQGYLQGQVNSPLSSEGVEQVRRLAENWKKHNITFDQIISSPLDRARRSAEIVADALGLQVEIDDIWIERHFGQLDGTAYEDLRQLDPPADFFLPFERIGQTGESMVDVYVRACRGLQGLLLRPPGRYLVVSHGAMLGRVMYAIYGITPQGHYNSPLFNFGNAAYAHFSYEPPKRQWVLLAFCSPDLWDGRLGD
jgi:broad specificity phosphatase PhoE